MRIPDQQLIICRHAQILLQPQPGAPGEPAPPDLPAGIAVCARHALVGAETSSGVTATGGATATCHLQGAEALYVGQVTLTLKP